MARNAEARIQAAIVEWVRTVAPQTIIFAVPNGGLRTKAEAALMKWTGALAGVPDLIMLAPNGRAFGLEVKTTDGRVSPEQRAMMKQMQAIGVATAVVRSLDDVRLALQAWGVETREAVLG